MLLAIQLGPFVSAVAKKITDVTQILVSKIYRSVYLAKNLTP